MWEFAPVAHFKRAVLCGQSVFGACRREGFVPGEHLPGLLDARAEARAAGQLAPGAEVADVADLGRDRVLRIQPSLTVALR